jgi:hypothetical protein
LTGSVDRVTEIDHELSCAEALRALAQTDGDDAQVRRLQQQIDELRRVNAGLRDQLRRRGGN